jgi:hypothetical protein
MKKAFKLWEGKRKNIITILNIGNQNKESKEKFHI